MKNIEQELKLSLSEREYNLLQNHANTSAELQTNYYFSEKSMLDTDMLRIRQKNDSFVLCLKRLLASGKANVWVSAEYSAEITAQQCLNYIENGISAAQLFDHIGVDMPHGFFYCGKLQTLRTKFVLAGFDVELDKNYYLGTTDFELECEFSDVLKFNALTSFLQYHFGIVICASKPKSQRFFEKLKADTLAKLDEI